MSKLSKNLIGLAVASCLVTPFSAMATNGILPLGNGMVAHGVGGAGMANGAETMSAVDNPALTSKVSNQWSVGASLFNPNRSASVAGKYVESDTKYFIIPQGGWLTNANADIDWGVLVYALGGMNTDYPASLLGSESGADLQGIIIAPTMSHKIGGNSAFGISLLLGYETLETKGAFGGNNKDSATGYGFKFGFVSDVSPDTTIGLVYQTEITMDQMDKHCNSGILSGIKTAGYDCALSLPTQYGVGLKQKLSDQWKLVADILQVQWSSVDVFEHGFGWKDQTIFKIGGEYMMSTDMAIRFGFNHGDSPVQNNKVSSNLAAPAVTEDHYTIGFTQKMGSNAELTGYYAYVPENEQKQTGAENYKIKMNQHALGIGFNKHF